MSQGPAPAGWYPDPQVPGGQRYWDGNQWGQQIPPSQPAPPPPHPSSQWSANPRSATWGVQAPPPAAASKPAKAKRRVGWPARTAILAVLAIVVIAVAANAGKKQNTLNTASGGTLPQVTAPSTTAHHATSPATHPKVTAPKQTTPPTTAPPTTPAPTAPSLTPSQQNAIDAAQQYLSMGQGFSRLGLIQQLSSQAGDGYPLADATFAVDSLHVDWNAQAALSAKSYLNMTSFSCSGLIQQLSSSAGEQFTMAQSQYGARAAGIC